MVVYVINKHGKPLMPCKPQKARKLLENGKAKVVQHTPFTIKLLYGSGGETQPITLGVDAGSKIIGISASTKEEELYSSEVILRKDIVDLLSTRRQNRRTRRNRKTRYRKARFLNRKRSKNWLAPSIKHKINSHITVVNKLHKILPITKIIVEVASFDIQKIKNPDIQGKEYQKGEQLGFWNVREYVLFRDGHKCQHCKGTSKDKILNVHHIESRKTGGDSPSNLITLCETCHKLFHKGEITMKIERGNSFRDAAFMGIMRWAFYNELKALYPDVKLTYGYLTKYKRINNNLLKTHNVDAYCIAGNLTAKLSDEYFLQKFVRVHNRQLHKMNPKRGKRHVSQAPKYVFGYQLFDKVLLDREEGFVFGRRSSGSFDVRKLNGEKLSAGVSYKKLIPLEKRKTILTERRTRKEHNSSPT